MKKKVLISYPEMFLGGSTTSLLSLLNTIDLNKYEIDLIMYKNQGDFMSDLPRGINVLPSAEIYKNTKLTKVKKLLTLIYNGLIFKALFYQIRYKKKLGLNGQVMAYAQASLSKKLTKKYDVAIGYLELWANAFVLNNVNAKKIVTWIHVDYSNAQYVPEIDIHQLEKSDAIVCVSIECLTNFNKDFPSLAKKTVFLDNILSEKYIRYKADEKILDFSGNYSGLKFITVCRLSIHTKGIDRAIAAMKKLTEEGYDFKWYIVGEGGEYDLIEDMIKKAGLTEKMILLGKKVNPYPYYIKCDLFVLPSRFEGKPMAVTEAQILGLPVVITNYSSATEQVINEIDGIIVNNDDESLYHGLKKILIDPELINKYKENLRKRKFSNENVIDKFYKLLE